MAQQEPSLAVPGIIVLLALVTPSLSACPWDDPDLERWSEPSTWDSGTVPAEGDAVVIPSYKRVLLDSPIPRLLTLTIDGVLVWGNVDDIRLETSYVLINGEFHVGSEDCNFEKEADIFLYGMSNSTEVVSLGGFGRKFIGAAGGSKLEIHGKSKKSWSKVVATVEPVESGTCDIVYDSRFTRGRRHPGIHMSVWHYNGSLIDFQVFNTGSAEYAVTEAQRLVDTIKNLPTSTVVGLGVYKTISSPGVDLSEVYAAVETLGASHIRNVKDLDTYSFVANMDDPSSAVEKHTRRALFTTSYIYGSEARATILFNDLAFSVRSYCKEHYSKYEARFRVLHKDISQPKLSLLHNVESWQVGDEIVVVSTDFDWRQAEVRTVVQCWDCDPNQIRVDSDFGYTHFGEVTYGVDERAEVGLLSRNIRIEAELQDDCYYFDSHEKSLCDKFHKDTYGGHVKVLRDAWARIEGVELTHLGQQSTIATYPLHFHMADEVHGMYLRNNVVRDANSRCITIHGTDYLEVSDNVCLNHLGHGIFLEDSAEQNNIIHRNLVLGTQYSTLLLTDMRVNWCKNRDWCDLLSSIWITHPNNIITENVAAGSDSFGFVFTFSDRPLGDSLQRQKDRGLYSDKSTRYTRVTDFSKNVMHSNAHDGLWFDSRLSYGIQDGNTFIPENAEIDGNFYSPRDPPNVKGKRVETVLHQATLYKNQDRNAWVRGGNIVFTNSSFADSPSSYLAAHTEAQTSVDVRHSIFIGQTANRGQPWTYIFNREFPHLRKSQRPRHHFDMSISKQRPNFPMGGVVFYQGPVYIDNCYFDQFFNWYYNDSMIDAWGYRPVRPAAAITFHPNNHYPMIPRNGVRNLKFGFCDGENNSYRFMNGNGSTPFWSVLEGTANANIRDYDGSLTGNPNTQVVQDRPFFTGPECLKKPDWGMSVCPYKYFWLIVRGTGGVLAKAYRKKTPVLISRDEQPGDVYAQKGERGNKYIVRVNQSYTIRFNSTLGPSPRQINFRPRFGLEANEVVRIAVCLPKSTTAFRILSTVPRVRGNPLWVTSLAELDADTTMTAFFWDRDNGYLYFKMSSPYNLTTLDEECPSDRCLDVNIIRSDGGDEPAVCTSPVTPYTPQVPNPPQVEEPVCDGPDSLEGLGAPIERGYDPPPPRPRNDCVST